MDVMRDLEIVGYKFSIQYVIFNIVVKNGYLFFDIWIKVVQFNIFVNKILFNSVKSFLKINEQKDIWEFFSICVFYDVI